MLAAASNLSATLPTGFDAVLGARRGLSDRQALARTKQALANAYEADDTDKLIALAHDGSLAVAELCDYLLERFRPAAERVRSILEISGTRSSSSEHVVIHRCPIAGDAMHLTATNRRAWSDPVGGVHALCGQLLSNTEAAYYYPAQRGDWLRKRGEGFLVPHSKMAPRCDECAPSAYLFPETLETHDTWPSLDELRANELTLQVSSELHHMLKIVLSRARVPSGDTIANITGRCYTNAYGDIIGASLHAYPRSTFRDRLFDREMHTQILTVVNEDEELLYSYFPLATWQCIARAWVRNTSLEADHGLVGLAERTRQHLLQTHYAAHPPLPR